MKIKEQKLPKWFDGELYKEGETVENPYSGQEIELTAVELSMYDFCMGATFVCEMQGFNADPQIVKDLRKGLDWFRMNNAEAYMILLD
tara:strand:+ start:781 stop:1044 length:264 start_codon:yes stop_codon:yes gene_type:complete